MVLRLFAQERMAAATDSLLDAITNKFGAVGIEMQLIQLVSHN